VYNKVFLIGRLGKDPEFRTVSGGTALVKFTLAMNLSVKTYFKGL